MKLPEQNDMETRILDAAKRVFVNKGYSQTSMNDVAKEVGIGRTALHYYFRTKEMLFEAILGQLMDLLLPNIKMIMDRGGTILEKAPLIVESYSKILQSNLLFPIFIVSELNRDPENLYHAVFRKPERISPIIELKAQLIEEMEKGLIRKINPVDLLSVMIGSMVFPILAKNLMTTAFYDGDEEEYRRFIASRTPFIKEMVLYALTPEKKMGTNESV